MPEINIAAMQWGLALVCAIIGAIVGFGIGWCVAYILGRNAGYEEGVKATLAWVTRQLWQDIEEGEDG
jgi:uncharacterized membrane protein YraQ (UPF0718 family)